MKSVYKILAVIVSFLGILSQCYSGYAATFVEIIRDDKFLTYIDTSSLIDKGDYVTIWDKSIPRGETMKEHRKVFGKTFSHSLNLAAFKKDTKEYVLISWYAYDKNGNLIDGKTKSFPPYNFEPIVPGTYGELMWERVMALVL